MKPSFYEVTVEFNCGLFAIKPYTFTFYQKATEKTTDTNVISTIRRKCAAMGFSREDYTIIHVRRR